MVIGFLSIAFENSLLKSLKRKSLQKRSSEELRRLLEYLQNKNNISIFQIGICVIQETNRTQISKIIHGDEILEEMRLDFSEAEKCKYFEISDILLNAELSTNDK